jgi:hypothetical protein
MKTPRELLLNQHRDKLPKLDAIREQVIATEISQSQTADAANLNLPVRMLLAFWNELILPARRIWAGIAVVWCLIIVVNAAESVHARNQWLQVKGEVSELLAAWRQQQRLAQLSESASTTVPQSDKPRSRSANPPRQKQFDLCNPHPNHCIRV